MNFESKFMKFHAFFCRINEMNSNEFNDFQPKWMVNQINGWILINSVIEKWLNFKKCVSIEVYGWKSKI